MLSLGDIQDGFASALLRSKAALPVAVRGRGDEAPERRFNVYRNNVAVSLVDAIAATFPAVYSLVGEEFFRAVAREFVLSHPPRSPVLIDYGGDFARFLDTFPPAQKITYLGDVARLEWAWTRAYHAAEVDSVGIAALGAIDPALVGSVRMTFHPSVQLLRSSHPVVALWAANTERANHEDVDLGRAEDVLVVRPQADVDVRLLPAGGYAFFSALADSMTLEEAAGRATAECAEFDLATHLTGLFETGAVVDIRASVAAAS